MRTLGLPNLHSIFIHSFIHFFVRPPSINHSKCGSTLPCYSSSPWPQPHPHPWAPSSAASIKRSSLTPTRRSLYSLPTAQLSVSRAWTPTSKATVTSSCKSPPSPTLSNSHSKPSIHPSITSNPHPHPHPFHPLHPLHPQIIPLKPIRTKQLRRQRNLVQRHRRPQLRKWRHLPPRLARRRQPSRLHQRRRSLEFRHPRQGQVAHLHVAELRDRNHRRRE